MTQASPAALLAQMSDITGLDHISWWPLAPGWWVLFVLIFSFLIASLTLFIRRRIWLSSWKGEAFRILQSLDKKAESHPQQTLADFSILLRRMAMQRFSREACAGLEGRTWLLWLKENDPKGFDWPAQGSALIEAPYAPPGWTVSMLTAKNLIAAAKTWVR
jgi:hypothetical protein